MSMLPEHFIFDHAEWRHGNGRQTLPADFVIPFG
jgi:hypothetical protein